jgi:polysaccharide pyruvyl transferase WcaK-like protein
MRVLILNSDSPKNRGDRAILSGLIEVVRRRWPDAEIASLSQYDERDEAWFGIRFLKMSPYSISPMDYLRLLRHARRADVILWGGGEILKDYTNRLGLVYWALKLTGLSLVNRRIFGAFQGIGPTSAASSQRLIAYTVNRTRGFVVRDEESAEKLRAWGVRRPVVASYDPAAIAPVADWTPGLEQRVHASLGIDAEFLDRAVGVGLRRWFHYRKGALLPFAITGGGDETPEFVHYRDNMVRLVDRLVEEKDATILFFPMHMAESEGDDAFAHDIISRMRRPDRARVLDEDVFAPGELSAVIRRCRFFVASRLHSAILAACARIPALVLYYVDKGRLFYEQLGLERLSRPIEMTLEDDAVEQVMAITETLDAERDAIVTTVDRRIAEMAERLVADAVEGWVAAPRR